MANVDNGKRQRPRFELARVYEDGTRQAESLALCDLNTVLRRGPGLTMARRGFLGLSALGTGALLAACGAIPTGKTTNPAASPTPTPLPQFGTVGKCGADAYTGPDDYTPYRYVGTLPAGTLVPVLGQYAQGIWVEVQTPEWGIAWVERLYLDYDPAFNSLPVVPTKPLPTPQPTPATPPPRVTAVPGCESNCTCNQICTCIPVFN